MELWIRVAYVEQSVISGGNDSRLHSGYEAESGEDCNVNSPVGVEKDTPVVLQDVGTTRAESAPGGSMAQQYRQIPKRTGDSAGLPGDEATMAEPARDTSSIMGKRTAGRHKTLPTKAEKAS